MELGGFIHRLHRLPQIILTEGPHVFPCQIGKGQVNSSRYVRSHSERVTRPTAETNCVEIPERVEPSSIWTSGGSGPSS